jgi:hypothetical protein
VVRTCTLIKGNLEQTDSTTAGQPIKTLFQPAPAAWQTTDLIHTLLLAENAPDLSLAPDVSLHGILQHVIAFHNGPYPVRIYLDATSHLPSAIEQVIVENRADGRYLAWNPLGDITDRYEFMNYDLPQGVRYPTQIDVFRNGQHMSVLTLSDVHFDTRPLDESLFAMADVKPPASIPRADDIALGQPISHAPDPKKPITEIAPGIVQIPGSWFSTIVRQPDGLVIIDAPISSGYSQRVMAEAARRFPGVPIKALVTSTAFYWHISGIREYAAKGIPIYVRDRNVPVVNAMMAAPHTLMPDDLATSSKAPDIHGISAPTTIGTGPNAITLFPISEGEQPMLMTSIPGAHLLHSGEMVQPFGPNGAPIYPEALLELKHSLATAGISTNHLRLIGMHLSPMPWTTVQDVLDHVTPL